MEPSDAQLKIVMHPKAISVHPRLKVLLPPVSGGWNIIVAFKYRIRWWAGMPGISKYKIK